MPVRDRIHSQTACIGGVVILREDGAALLQHRDDKPGLPHAGLWVFPGGHCEPGEPLDVCARRECYEETDYRCGELYELETLHDLAVEGFPSIRLTVFWSRYDGVQQVTCREGQTLAFIARRDADRHPMPHYLLRLWDKALAQTTT